MPLFDENIFLREQVFVVFHPGASGNFFTNLIRNLKNNFTDHISIGPTGSCHTITPEIEKENRLFSCGTFFIQQAKIKPYSFENRVSYYKNYILQHFDPTIKTGVTWTHDFTNIPVYRKLFPNSKILAVTQETPEEKLCVTILQQLKNILSKDALNILSESARAKYNAIWEQECKEILRSIVGVENESLIEDIFKDRFNHEYRDILTYLSVYRILQESNMLGILDNYDTIDTINYVSYYDNPNSTAKNKRILIGPYSKYIDDNCFLLPYKYIMCGNTEQILDTFTNLLGPLSETQQKYAASELERYRTNQPYKVLKDPIGYMKSLRDDVMNQISIIVR